MPGSDLDLRLATAAAPGRRALTWFLEGIHVSVVAKTVVEAVRPREPMKGGLGFPGISGGVWRWAEAGTRAAIGDPAEIRYPAAEPGLETLVEGVAKALRASDAVALRVAARTVGERAVRNLRALSPERVVVNRTDAVRAALELAVVPPG